MAVVVVAALAAALACLVAGSAGASDPSPVALEWEGPSECQAAPRVLSEIRRLLGGERAGSSLVARAKVERSGRRWHLLLTTQRAGRSTARELDAESCDAAADAASVILALMIDPSRALASDGESEQSSARSTPEEDAAPRPADAANERDAGTPLPAFDEGKPDVSFEALDAGARAPFPLFLIATAASDTGTLPHTAFGFAGGIGFRAGRFQADATLAYWPPVNAEIGAARGGSFTMLAATLRACVLAEAGLFSFGPCAGGGLTRMEAEGFGVTTPIAADSTWATFVADALVRAEISRFLAPRLSAGASVPFYRPVFEVQGLGVVHQPAAIALQIGAGLEVHF